MLAAGEQLLNQSSGLDLREAGGEIVWGLFKMFGASEAVANKARIAGGRVVESVKRLPLAGGDGDAASSARFGKDLAQITRDLNTLSSLAGKVPGMNDVSQYLRELAASSDKLRSILNSPLPFPENAAGSGEFPKNAEWLPGHERDASRHQQAE